MHKGIEIKSNPLLERLKNSRDVPAVLKTKLLNFRTSVPGALIFVFEGVDDKTVYFHWIKRICSEIRYEPFLCGGKNDVLRLKDVLDRDVHGQSEGVYFFVDRDYDELRGREPSENVFMTDTYSFENHLVSNEILEEILKNEFNCHAEPESRKNVLPLFGKVYDAFIIATCPINRRIFLHRKCQINRLGDLPNQLSKVVDVTIDTVKATGNLLEELVPLEREPSSEEQEKFEAEFLSIDPKLRYRGKFALMFFRRWLDLLALDRNGNKPKYFCLREEGELKARNQIDLNSLASKADYPSGLREFVMAVRHKQHGLSV